VAEIKKMNKPRRTD